VVTVGQLIRRSGDDVAGQRDTAGSAGEDKRTGGGGSALNPGALVPSFV